MNQPPDTEGLVKLMKDNKISGVSAKGRQFINRKYVAAFRDAGLSFYVWTIKNKERMVYYQSLGVDGVITDYPDLW